MKKFSSVALSFSACVLITACSSGPQSQAIVRADQRDCQLTGSHMSRKDCRAVPSSNVKIADPKEVMGELTTPAAEKIQ